ncbi:MAG: uracil-DNA glycosylase [Palaeococcus sp.]|uniref:uracil-DNA glycosylase family protein n=1 Tax=Palaeococcus sp. (in: euryarchaeotes) TaxID=2820298 RepID=UPI0025D1FE35|nr:uracil-DNA glycosylase family protein [Palaeococcus sp. (in: euryarchaeotes)]MCD6558776.1 uracil-DNA glycosylase [Palaeococcus sp. (in: euryarchaeotes)]
MLLMFESLKRVGEIYINPRNFKIMPMSLRTWKDLLSLDEKTYGLYARTIYNPKERFLVKNKEDREKALKLDELYRELLQNPLRFCHEEYYKYQLEVKQFDGLPFGNGWVGSKVVLVGEAPGRKGCGLTGICFYRDASGMLLRRALFSLGINPDFLYITNVVKCNPPGNKLKGFDERELSLLKRELEILKPKAIFAIGRTAEKALRSIGFGAVYLRHPAWYVRRGVREPGEEMLEEYSEIMGVIG